MQPYDDLIKTLRLRAALWEKMYDEDNVLKQAANAIEELSKPKWIKFVLRPLTEEEQRDHPEWCYILDCPTPDDEQEIIVSDGRYVWTDTFHEDGDQCYLDGGAELESCWWKPMPEPPKEETK